MKYLFLTTLFSCFMMSIGAWSLHAQGVGGKVNPVPVENAVSTKQDGWQVGIQTKQDFSSVDRKFIKEAAEGNWAEIQMGELAAEKGQDPAVRALGEAMVKDHRAAREKLQEIVKRAGVEMPQTPTDAAVKKFEELERISSTADFDKKFLEVAKKDHEKALNTYHNEIVDGQNIDLRQYAGTTVPELAKHYVMAEQAGQALSSRRSS